MEGMSALRVIAVDDERIALHDLCTKLRGFPGVGIVHAETSAEKALSQILDAKPDAVFLDIHMPGQDGFALASLIPQDIPIIFVTASDAHAIRAFEVNALDYLVKPVSPERLKASLERLDRRTPGRVSASRLGRQDMACLPTGNSRLFIPMHLVLCLESRRNYSRAHLQDGRRFLIKRSLNQWEARLDPRHYFRANRNWIVNLEHVREAEASDGSTLLRLQGQEKPLKLSRRQSRAFRKLWKK
jgi:two-component system LytT family response regulator